MVAILLHICEIIRIVLFLTYPVANFCLNLVYRLLMGPTKTLPPIDNKILLMPATELAEKIRKRQLTCKDVMRAYIQRSQLIHDSINAVTDQRYVEALQDAVAVDRFLESGEKTEEQIAEETPLLGVPFSCKEVLGVKGLAQTTGLTKAKGHLAEEDGDAPAMYRKAGAIPVTVTNVPEICMWWETANHVYGITKNPFDNRRTVGGSTGGEAALLTGAGAIIGIGTDIGGSIRIPSAFCGTYGHKPSRGIVSNWGTFPYCQKSPDKNDDRPQLHFVSTGPMCRYASDLPLLLKVLSGNDKRIRLNEKVDFRKVKVYYMKGLPGRFNSARPDVRKAIIKAAKHFEEEFGVKPIPLDIKEMQYAFALWNAKYREIGAGPLKNELCYGKKSVNLWLELVKSFFRCSDHTLPLIYFGLLKPMDDKRYHKCLEMYKSLHKKFEAIFEEDAIFLFPTHPEPAPHYLMTIPKFFNAGYTAIFNILGYPVTAIPAGLSDGLPISIQAISGQFKDHLTIAAAQELDKVFGGWINPCPINV
ncbi:fatty-acid amide hydrolase 2-like [Argiope bruennichi]|uniref:fatty-acid amide hydrolase 2-like n=1 Tax=Argiope bruennichi TaxID=94029 RepID=UPI0024940ACC|nr:fatty-acid amide hydrolase 2-like [Argiope bruennichi]